MKMRLTVQDPVAGVSPVPGVNHHERAGALLRTGLMLGTAFAGLGVAFGALGAHALRSMLGHEMMDVFETGVRYQMYHAFAIIAAGLMTRMLENSLGGIRVSIVLFAAGIILFSGSLYAIALTGRAWIGYFTPLGGLAFIAGWVSLLLAIGLRRVKDIS